MPDLADLLPASLPPPTEDVVDDLLPDLRDLSPLLNARSESPTPEAAPPPWAPLRDDDSGSELGTPTVDLAALRPPSPSGRFLDRFRRQRRTFRRWQPTQLLYKRRRGKTPLAPSRRPLQR